ncbi:neuronal acetylcholine receptor subunit alpha-10-like isoform X2 [Liolophura sinensis]|uniref:neuronal acetylcholine receptor subunit alpha-10-like isoform X2 n=1 Tax=Liolophura sinensis TaxID=3198878 RepID=UPI003158F6EB
MKALWCVALGALLAIIMKSVIGKEMNAKYGENDYLKPDNFPSVKWIPSNDIEERIPDEQKLMMYLTRGYEKSVRPVRNASTPVIVHMGLTLTQIFDLEEKNQILVTNVWLDQEWTDEFMTWDPKNFNDIQIIRIPCDKLWLPDIVLYNNAAEYTDGLMPANAMVKYDGNVFWPVPTKLQSSCKVDVTYFPFDEQRCKLKFGSWTYDGFQLDITNRSNEVDLTNYVNNGEWDLVKVEVQRNVVYYSCCPEPFPDVTFHVIIQRRILYYMYNVVFPCIMMSALTLLVFCLPPDSGEKIALGITVLLAFSVFMLAIAENLPETSEFVPLISIYLTIVMSLTSLSVIMTVFVLNLHHRGPSKQAVPVWLRNIFLGRMARLLCLPAGEPTYRDYYSGDTAQFLRKVSLKMTIENMAQELKDDLENGMADTLLDQSGLPFSNEKQESRTNSTLTSDHYRRTNSKNPRNVSKTNEEILRALKRLIEKHDREDHEYEIIQEWRKVAQVVDRILFWIFLTGTLVSTLTVLVIAPLTRSF